MRCYYINGKQEKMCPYKLKKLFKLKADFTTGYDFSLRAMAQIGTNTTNLILFYLIFYGQEAHFTLNCGASTQNCRIYSAENPQ